MLPYFAFTSSFCRYILDLGMFVCEVLFCEVGICVYLLYNVGFPYVSLRRPTDANKGTYPHVQAIEHRPHTSLRYFELLD